MESSPDQYPPLTELNSGLNGAEPHDDNYWDAVFRAPSGTPDAFGPDELDFLDEPPYEGNQQ